MYPSRAISPCRLLTTIAVALTALMLVGPPHASAAESYKVETTACSTGWGGGQYDSNGTTYIACGTQLHVIARNGVRNTYPIPNAHDAAPSPDGRYVYVSDLSTVKRLSWNGNGYTHDVAWKLGTYPYGGMNLAPRTYWIASDAWGSLYVTDASYHTIVKYDANGRYVTRFGEYTNGHGPDASSWAAGEFYWRAGGIGVSRDGRHVYVGEVGNNRVQRFDWQPNGHYVVSRVWGNTREFDPTRVGSCADGRFAAPYDVGVDPWGFVYVSNTTCGQFQKFTADGGHLYSSATKLSGTKRNHGIAVDAHGNAYSAELAKRIVRTTPEPGPWPQLEPLVADTVAPTLRGVVVPAETTTRNITVAITATDDRRVTEYRAANEDGTWGAWKAFAPNATGTAQVVHTLSAGYAIKGVYIQVRDAADNQSTYLYRTLRYMAATADTVAPALTGITVPATTAEQQVTVGIEATDNVAVAGYRIANEDGNWGAWTAYAATVQHTLTPGYGTKGIYVQVRDAAGNDSIVIYRTLGYAAAGGGNNAGDGGGVDGAVAVDDADPIIVTATMPEATSQQQVTISVEATDDTGVTAMRFANEDGNWLAWKAFAVNAQHELSAGYGGKAVYVQVRDAAGRESNVLLLRTRYQQDVQPGVVDAAAPTLDALEIPATTVARTIAVTITASDDVGVTEVRFANEDGNWGPWVARAQDQQHTLSAGYGLKAVYAQVRDAAGNESNTKMVRTTFQAA